MKWHEIREYYPHSWVLIEAIDAYEQNNKWIVNDISVINQFQNAMDAMNQYELIHNKQPGREVLVANTENTKLDIDIQHWTGIRRKS